MTKMTKKKTQKTSKQDKKLKAEMTAAMVLNLAKDAASDKKISSAKRQARSIMNEKRFAERVITDDKTKRKLGKQVKELQLALAKACDWALDAADVIADEGIADPEDDEDGDFRDVILGLRELSGQLESGRHAERRKAREAKKEEADRGRDIAIAAHRQRLPAVDAGIDDPEPETRAPITDEMVEEHARQTSPELWAKIDANEADDDWNGATAANARAHSLGLSREALEQEPS